MANQAPSRPWFRLASLRSVAAPPPPPPAQDHPRPPPSAVPAERGYVPSSPAQKLPFQSSSSLPNSPLQNGSLSTSSSVSSSSPIQKLSPPPSSASSPAKGGTGPSSKQVVQTVIQSLKAKPTTPPPSPLTLPPAQLKPKIPEEAEFKNVIHQKRIEKPKQLGNDNSWETQKNHNEKKQNGNHRMSWGSEDSPTRVITIAGENRGAYMELIQSPKKLGFGNKSNHLYKSENRESGSSSSDMEKKENNKNKRRTKSSHQMSAFMNSNVQCVNNSLLYNASCSHQDPGVRLSLARKPFENGGFHLKEIANGRHD